MPFGATPLQNLPIGRARAHAPSAACLVTQPHRSVARYIAPTVVPENPLCSARIRTRALMPMPSWLSSGQARPPSPAAAAPCKHLMKIRAWSHLVT